MLGLGLRLGLGDGVRVRVRVGVLPRSVEILARRITPMPSPTKETKTKRTWEMVARCAGEIRWRDGGEIRLKA